MPVENNIRYADTWALEVTDKTLAKYTLRDNTSGLVSTFNGCTSLVRITLPNSLKHIDGGFIGCKALKSLTLPDGLFRIGHGSFSGCSSLEKINIPLGITRIEEFTFYNCALKEISIPKGVTEICERAFYNNNLTSVELPEDITSIGDCAFQNCPLSSITIPEGVKSVGKTAFSSPEKVILNSSIISVAGDFKSKFGHYVKTYIIGAEIEEIVDYAFYGYTALLSVTLPGSLNSIGESAFENCSGMEFVKIPTNVSTIKNYAFAGCTGLKSMVCDSPVPPVCGTDVFADVATAECTLEVPDKQVSVYATTAPWSMFDIVGVEVPESINLVDGTAFVNSKDVMLNSITYTRTLNNTEWNALYLPFEIPVSQLTDKYEVAYINAIHSYDEDDNGEIDRMSMEVIKLREGTLHANHPYLIKARTAAAKQMSITVENTTLHKAESRTLDCSSVYTKFEITGIYEKMTSAQLAGCYALSGGSWKNLASGSSLNPFRLYLRVSSREGSPVKLSEAALARIGIHVQGEETATSVEERLMQKQHKADAVYDLSGRRVTHPKKGQTYIVNGKKRMY